jgi:prepilin-type N-terminal cleavage/methylation domain-containing protein
MKRMIRKKGFTLIELSISSLIIALIVLVLIMVFRSNLNTWNWGQQHMEFNQRVQLVMKQIFTDLKNVNPILARDEDGHLYFQGEKINDMFPNLVTIYDKDKNQFNGGEELVLFHTSVDNLDQKDRIRYFLEKGSLIRETKDYNGNTKKKVVAAKASDLFFKPDPGDIRQVMVKLTVINKKDEKIKENLDFAVRLETDLVCVKLVQQYD